MEWHDRVVLITGGAHRLGKAMALRAAEMGAHVAITYYASAEAAQATCAEIIAMGRRAIAIQCNQAEVGQITPTVETVIEHLGRLDGLVNSASSLVEIDFFAVTERNWDEVFAVNTRGAFFFTQAAARHMLAHDGGVIVNLIDESVLRPSVEYPIHTISKSALWALTKLSAKRLAPSIRVNAILPGAVLKPSDWEEPRWQALADFIPLKRLGSPEDVCRALAFLFYSDFVTGQMIVVEGGTTV